MPSGFKRWLRGRPSTTESTTALWTTALFDALIFGAIFFGALPWVANRLLRQTLPLPSVLKIGGGAVLISVGAFVLSACLDAFVRRGRGTPLPSEAPRHLVTDGLFAVVRNPIIVAEMMVIWGEALYVGSLGLVLYAVLFSIAGHLVVVYVEEPELRRRFGNSYEEYRRDVPRWLPKLRPK